MDTTALQNSFRALLQAAATVNDSGDAITPPAGEWTADQVLAHVALVNAATITAVSSVTAGGSSTYDNRLAHDRWTNARVVARAGGNAGLQERIRAQGEALCALSGPTLGEAELDTLLPALLLSDDEVLVEAPVSLRDILGGLAHVELPGHTKQLLDLLPGRAAQSREIA